MIKLGGRIDINDDEGNTPLHCSSIRGTPEVGSFLLKLGADPYARNKKGLVPYEMNTREEIQQVYSVCMVCQSAPALILCNYCSVIRYCNLECQKKDWIPHKRVCDLYKRRVPGGVPNHSPSGGIMTSPTHQMTNMTNALSSTSLL